MACSGAHSQVQTGLSGAGRGLPGTCRAHPPWADGRLETVVLVPNSVIPLPLCTGLIAGLPCPSSHPEARQLGQAGRASQRKTRAQGVPPLQAGTLACSLSETTEGKCYFLGSCGNSWLIFHSHPRIPGMSQRKDKPSRAWPLCPASRGMVVINQEGSHAWPCYRPMRATRPRALTT